MHTNTPTPYVARVERVYRGRTGRVAVVQCPFLCGWGTHEHTWPQGQSSPSREVLAPCAGQLELRTYAIDPETAANAGQNAGSQAKAANR